MNINKKTLFKVFLILIILGILFLFLFLFLKNYFISEKFNFKIFNKITSNVVEKENCDFQEVIKTVCGNSLEPLVSAGSQIKVLLGYYQCNEIKRNDLVLYDYAGNDIPLLKIVKAIPQDTFKLLAIGDNYYNLFINKEIVINSQKFPYIFNEKQYKMLLLYEKDYKNIIPQNTYLLLGDRVNGTVDSTVFGLINSADILGKAVIK